MPKAEFVRKVSITILIPFGGFTTNVKFTLSLARLINYSTLKGIIIDDVLATERHMVHWSRDLLAREALKKRSEYFLWLDDDHDFAPDTLEKLLVHKDKDIVSAMYCERKSREPILVYKIGTEAEDGISFTRYSRKKSLIIPKKLIKVDSVGFGFLLMNRKVLEGIVPPYFRFLGSEGETGYFCSKAEKAGFVPYVDGSTVIGHLGEPVPVYPS
jgi:hypothetical protein